MMDKTDSTEPRKDRHLMLIASRGEAAPLPRRDRPSAEVYLLREDERQLTVKLVQDVGGTGPRSLRTRTPTTDEADVPRRRRDIHPGVRSDRRQIFAGNLAFKMRLDEPRHARQS